MSHISTPCGLILDIPRWLRLYLYLAKQKPCMFSLRIDSYLHYTKRIINSLNVKKQTESNCIASITFQPQKHNKKYFTLMGMRKHSTDSQWCHGLLFLSDWCLTAAFPTTSRPGSLIREGSHNRHHHLGTILIYFVFHLLHI